MCGYESRCGPGSRCYDAVVTLGCLSIGGKCLGCARAILTTTSPQLSGNQPSADDTTGLLLNNSQGDFIGWKITQVGLSTGLQVGDIVTAINNVAPDEDFFEWLATVEGQAMTFNLAFVRGTSAMTLTLTRS